MKEGEMGEVRNSNRRHRATRIAEADHTAFPANRLHASFKSTLAHTVKDDLHTPTATNLLDLLRNRILRIINHMIRPIIQRKLALLRRRRRPDRRGPNRLQDLTQPQSYTARRRVHEHVVSLLDFVRFPHEGQCRQSLQDRGSRVLLRDGGGDLDGFFGGAGGVLGVGSCRHPHDTVAGHEGGDVAGTGGDDFAFGFAAEDFGFGGGVEAGAEVASRDLSAASWSKCG